ncbi:hypothetical protein KDL01_06700 [Actinospica durhamensis]|uniref:Uncharacterized protein n=1 Tax=Actinospica durhamensis TaxID=1508375 RepID=A0A941EL84_9ACTN|nr:hypothetical protein [Actinospica durhamensis]MBR7832943.1 hypothetical protein [Actinospica durhamensis]
MTPASGGEKKADRGWQFWMTFATVNQCFAVSGPSNDLTFNYTSACTAGDAVATAHYGVDDAAYCENSGYATGDLPGFPGLA